MKKIIAIFLTALFLIIPVMAGYEPGANVGDDGKIKFEFKGYADKPAIDGKFDEFGYSKLDIKPADLSFAFNDATADGLAAAQGLAFDVYASYDADYIYLFVSTDTKYYYNDMDLGSGDIWAQSAIQVNIANTNNTADERLEYGIGRNSVSGELQFFAWAQHPESAKDIELVAGTDFAVVIDGNRINYECRTPVETFSKKDTKLKAGDAIKFCLVMAQCDKNEGEGGTGGYLHTQVAAGCTGDPGKNVDYFATVTLAAPIEKPAAPAPVVEEAAPVVAEAAPVEAAPAPTPAVPQTGDATMIMMFVLLAVAAIGTRVVIKQNRK